MTKPKAEPLPSTNLEDTTLGGRIRAARETIGWTQQQLGDAMGVSSQAVSQWEKNKTIPNLTTIIKMAQELGSTIEYLTGTKRLTVREFIDRQSQHPESPHIPVALYSLTEVVDQGPGKLPSSNRNILWASLPFAVRGELKAFMIFDRSMSPEYEIGDYIIIDEGQPPEPGDVVVALLNEPAQLVVRKWRLVRRSTQEFEQSVDLVSLNPDYPVEPLASGRGDIVLGVVVEHRRHRRRHQ